MLVNKANGVLNGFSAVVASFSIVSGVVLLMGLLLTQSRYERFREDIKKAVEKGELAVPAGETVESITPSKGTLVAVTLMLILISSLMVYMLYRSARCNWSCTL